jgi:hypothetical protein
MSEMSRYEQIYCHQNFCVENIKIEVKSKQIQFQFLTLNYVVLLELN